MFNLVDQAKRGAVIKVIGVGGAGRNAVSYMLEQNIMGAEFICANTDAQAMIEDYDNVTNIQLGRDLTRGLGAGAKPDIGRQAALENKDQITDVIQDADLIFIAAGMGGGTGTGAAPVVAQLAKEHDILTVAVVTTPFKHEGKNRARNAKDGLEEIAKHIDSLITVDNNKLINFDQDDITVVEAFAEANKVLSSAVQSITELVTRPGHINVDFADLKTVMSETGMAMMGTGSASGSNRAIDAVDAALNSPLINQNDMSQAKGMLVNITGSSKMRLSEYNAICEYIQKLTDNEANIVSGMLLDEEMGDSLRVSVIAAGLKEVQAEKARVAGEYHTRARPNLSQGRYATVRRPVVHNKAEPEDEMVSVPAFLRNQAD